MTRSIRLQLGPNTTATHCGDCPKMNVSPFHFDHCKTFGVRRTIGNPIGHEPLRNHLCIQAEAALSVPTTYNARPKVKR